MATRARNHCNEWGELGIPCPAPLLAAVEERKKRKERDPVDDSFAFDELFVFDKVKKKEEKGQQQQMQMAVMLELYRSLGGDAVSSPHRPGRIRIPVPPVRVPVPVPIPVPIPISVLQRIPLEIIVEAVLDGGRGIPLGLLIAAAALSGAVLLKFGPGAVQALPKALAPAPFGPGRGGGPGMGGKSSGFGARFFSAGDRFMQGKQPLRPRLDWNMEDLLGPGGGYARTGAGEFFPGILG